MRGAEDVLRAMTCVRTPWLAVLFLDDISDEDERDAVAGRLLRTLLDLYAVAARRVRTETGLVAVYAALSEISGSAGFNERIAARMILGHSQFADTGVDTDLRDIGATTFNDAIRRMDACGAYEEVVAAIAATWKQLLPELHTQSGMQLLEQLAIEMITDEGECR